MATIAVGAGSSAPRSTFIASPQTIVTPVVLGRDPLERLPQPLVELDHLHRPGLRRQALGQHPLPSPDLEHDVAGIERGVGDDRLEQVRVGEEVLP